MSDYHKVTPGEAKEMMEQEPVRILDVRTKDEYGAGHIPGAILIPDDRIEQEAPEKLPDQQEKILVYCKSGIRSRAAAETLLDMGYTNIVDFGGILDWSYGLEEE